MNRDVTCAAKDHEIPLGQEKGCVAVGRNGVVNDEVPVRSPLPAFGTSSFRCAKQPVGDLSEAHATAPRALPRRGSRGIDPAPDGVALDGAEPPEALVDLSLLDGEGAPAPLTASIDRSRSVGRPVVLIASPLPDPEAPAAASSAVRRGGRPSKVGATADSAGRVGGKVVPPPDAVAVAAHAALAAAHLSTAGRAGNPKALGRLDRRLRHALGQSLRAAERGQVSAGPSSPPTR